MATLDIPPVSTHASRDSDSARLERKMDNLTTAVFGNPMDSEDHGLLGDLREVKQMLSKVFFALFPLAGVLLAVAVTIALSVH